MSSSAAASAATAWSSSDFFFRAFSTAFSSTAGALGSW